jgi:hypothetical protein
MGNMLDTQDRPGLDEQYIVATNTSDLSLNPDRVCSATHLIAAGLLGNRMGEALVHLRAEWDTASKPPKPTDDDVAARAAELPKRKGKPDLKRARGELRLGYSIALRKRAEQMRGMAQASGLMRQWALVREFDPDLVPKVLYYWLNPVCPACDGRKFVVIPDTPALSSKQCHHCEGHGTWPKPLGSDRALNWLKGCAGKAKGDRAGLLNGRIDAEDLQDRASRRVAPPAEDERGNAAVAAVMRDVMGKRRKV